ncbi:ABC transporter ATP-binding protein [Burkholderia pyrrocinia]|uniref:ABC transporter ATP-binding protein n=1 Tax=Burkholderia pyrrocinia TaxID=60550 RepID=UPI002AAFEB75|nr:ABC transporter ATP-binding protein [Burkholderia pyrrocinia]
MNDLLLKISGLGVAFKEREVVRNVSLEINRGECVALVGESGSGKSVTSHAVLRLLPKHASIEGSIEYAGIDLTRASQSVLQGIRGNRISMIFQEPMTSLNPLHTVERQVGEALLLHRGMGAAARRQRVVELLTEVGIPEPASRLGAYPHQLSGGQRQRVMIAMALACEPELLIADEPTTALDVIVQRNIIDLLRDIQKRCGMSLLIISHDLNVVRRIADRVCVMREGEIVEANTCGDLFARPTHSYTRMMIDAEPSGRPQDENVTGVTTLLKVEGLSVAYARKRAFFRRAPTHYSLRNATFSLRPGRTLGVVGESGSGKSTLGQALLRLIPSEGRITFKGADLDGLTAREMRKWRSRMQIVFQDPFGSLSSHMSVEQIIGEGLREHSDLSDDDIDRKVVQALRDVQLDPECRHRFAHEFSGGQRQRISIARAIILRPELIVMDEPTSALDRTVQKQVVELLRNLQERFGLAYVFISHDLAVVRALAHDVMVLRHGSVVESGPANEILSAPKDAYTKALIEASSVRFEAVTDTASGDDRYTRTTDLFNVMRQ